MITLSILAVCCIGFYSFDLYNIRKKFIRIRLLANVIGALILILLISIALFYVFPYLIGRGVFLISLVLIGIFVYTWRLFYSFFFKLAVTERNVLIIGTGRAAKAIYSALKNSPEYQVVGFIGDNPKIKEFSDMKILGNNLSLEKITKDYKVNDIVMAGKFAGNKNLNRALVNCKMQGLSIYDIARFYEYLMQKLPISHIEERWLLYNKGFDNISDKINIRVKRIIDILISSIFLIVFFPCGLIISVLIKLTSKGPIFLVQERVGENYSLFNLIKFRTMVVEAEKGEPKWAKDNDPRVTIVGKILRKTRVDEWPQLINVAKGEMSLVGPRPERDFFVRRLIKKIPFYFLRFTVKPGLTGWAQINYPYGSSEKDALEKLQYELYYIKNMSLILDFKILLKTIKTVLFGMGR